MLDYWIIGLVVYEKIIMLQPHQSIYPLIQQSSDPNMKPTLIDTHAHLHLEQFDGDRDTVLHRAREAGVVKIITIGTDVASSRQAIALAEKYERVFAAVGIHPTDCGNATDTDFEEIRKMAQHPRAVAIGEIGLDFYWKDVAPETQRRAFVRQLALARELRKPVIIHNREAGEAILQTLRKENIRELRGVFHCFSEDVDFARRVLELGSCISFTGNLTYKKSTLPEVAAQLPLNRIMIETDAPFMAPVPHRGKRNEPAYVVHVAEKLAEIKKLPVAEIAKITTENAHRLFGL
jgi:TatD DNase family protein